MIVIAACCTLMLWWREEGSRCARYGALAARQGRATVEPLRGLAGLGLDPTLGGGRRQDADLRRGGFFWFATGCHHLLGSVWRETLAIATYLDR